MRVLAVGGGAREHAIVSALARSGAEVFVCMKNSNPGIARLAKAVALVDETDVSRVVGHARGWGAELAVVGPEAPLEAGLADGLESAGIPTASPRKAAARIETSKSFMRNLMDKHRVKGAVRFVEAEDADDVRAALDELGTEVVVKPVGLTGGKGVKVFGEHMRTREDVFAYAEEILSKHIGGGAGMVIEEKLVGEEFTVQAFCDGRRVVPMPAVQDHKRAYEGDKGPNTGGMGSYSQADGLLPFLRRGDYDEAVSIMSDTLAALREDGSEYRGTLYGQFMITKDGPKVIEFNARFGDPEAMNVLSLLRSDFSAVCAGMAGGDLSGRRVEFERKARGDQGRRGGHRRGGRHTLLRQRQREGREGLHHHLQGRGGRRGGRRPGRGRARGRGRGGACDRQGLREARHRQEGDAGREGRPHERDKGLSGWRTWRGSFRR